MNSTAGDGFPSGSRVASNGPKEGRANDPSGYPAQNYQNKLNRVPAGLNGQLPKDVVLNQIPLEH